MQGAGIGLAALLANGVNLPPAYARPRGDGFGFNEEIDWFDFIRLAQTSWSEYWGHSGMFARVGQGVVCQNDDGSPSAGLKVFTQPAPGTRLARDKVCRHYVMPLFSAVHGERYNARSWSPIWYDVGTNPAGERQYVHSAFVVPTREIFQNPIELEPGEWFWGEVTVPWTPQFKQPSFGSYYDFDYYINYYAQVHQVIASATDDAGNVWYKLYDDIEESREAWVLARTIRRIDESEFSPISPNVTDKVIEIDIGSQVLTCLEEGHPVFRTRIASGTVYNTPDGAPIDFSTPYGEYSIQGKRPSRRMRGGEKFNLAYDVNGVPWVTYFSFSGAAVHGAYWHNNFGVPRSHGCINVTPDAAKWVYRWSQPYVSYETVSRLSGPEFSDQLHTTLVVV